MKQQRYIQGDTRLSQILSAFDDIATGNLNVHCHGNPHGDELDTILDGLNHLAEQMRAARVSAQRAQPTNGALKEAQAQLVATSKMSALGEMASNIAHEINNPLTVIYGKAMMLRRAAESGRIEAAKLVETAGQIEAMVFRITRVIKGLRTCSRSGIEDRYHQVSLASIIEDVLAFSREKFRYDGIELIVEPLPESLTVECRPGEISRGILNLLGNAHDAIEGRAEKWIRIAACEAKDDVLLSIADSGPGIPPSERESIFEPFYTTKASGKGIGLGLSIARDIAMSHGGALAVDASRGNTTFVLKLPKHQLR